MQHVTEPKNLFSLFLGLLLLILGTVPLLVQFNVLKFALPGFLTGLLATIGLYVIAGAGLVILVDGFMEDHAHKTVTLVAGFIFLALGIVAILGQRGVLPFSIPLSLTIYYFIFTIEAIFLLIAAFTML